MKDSERQAVLGKLNEIRARHGLLAVTYEAAHDVAAAEAALYMVANRLLTHTPSASGLCYSTNAYNLASTGNLHLGWKSSGTNYDGLASTSSLVGFLIDDDVPSLGHRRWMLDPFLGKTTYGRVDGVPNGTSSVYSSSVLKVIGNGRGNVSAMTNDYVAYPQGNYSASEFGKSWFLSFSAIASKTSAGANGGSQVSYATATVTVSGPGGTLGISEQSADYNGYGLANNLQWKVAGLQNNVDYNVAITNVIVNSSPRTYHYSFRLQ
ncbi:CAP domain-containing protein [Uliginosibacterium sp. H1]|uniref:CAP domain-containing protein n=1 Tax=Uliginosibacterium sp. H1 TaxID=3114757 RepID=UPI002E1804FB|nr:CAP domain-containing protein [Uliginosibacterium sp. H1]